VLLPKDGDALQQVKRGNEETRRRGDEETRRRGDEETRRRGDEETRRRGDEERLEPALAAPAARCLPTELQRQSSDLEEV
jgi:hypothetical protein